MSRHYRVTYRLVTDPTNPDYYRPQPHITVAAANAAHAMRLVPGAVSAEPVNRSQREEEAS